MVRIANENMANAIRIVTVEQGIDPRELAIVAMGGAGPTHAAEIADALGMTPRLVPVNPGLCSAFGALAAPLRVDAVKSVHLTDARTTAAEVSRPLRGARTRVRSPTSRRRPGSAPRTSSAAQAAMRYQGQNYEQEVTVPGR